MTTTAQYLKKVLITLLDHAFDPTAQRSNSNEYEDISPQFCHDEDALELHDDDVSKSIEEALFAEDRAALMDGDHAGLLFLEQSSQVTDIVHGIDCPGSCQEKHINWLDNDVADNFVKYCITWAWKPGYLGRGTEIPGDLHEHLRRALLMQNLCEWAVIILFQSVKDIVLQLDRQAQVYQMVVAPRRHFQITSAGNPIAATHSLFLICSPLGGNFILDPTAEQYGIPREHRFLPWSVYMQLNIIDLERLHGVAVWSVDFSGYQHWLERSDNWDFWSSIGAVLDAQTDAWLQDCELRTAMARPNGRSRKRS